MVNTKFLKKYIESRDALKAGNPETAAQLLAESVGAKVPTPYMKETLEELAEPNEPILTLILHESKGERDA